MPRGPKGEARFNELRRTPEPYDARRFTRLTNAFPKKFENHMHMVALYTVWYNFVKQHKSLKGLSPAMAAGVSETLWSMTDLAEMIDVSLSKPGKRGPYEKQTVVA